MQSIKLSEIIKPGDYIRERPDSKRIDDFVHVAAGLTPDQKLPKNKDGSLATSWPFPPIRLVKTTLTKEIVGKALKEGETKKVRKGKVKELTRYEIIDGVHRFLTAKRLKMREIPAEIDGKVKTPADKFLAQFEASALGNLPLEPIQRAQAIWKMVNVYKIPQIKITSLVGLSKASVSKIAAKKQGWVKPGRASPNYGKKAEAERTASAAAKGAEPSGLLFSDSAWFDHLLTLCEEYKKQREKNYYQSFIAEKADPKYLPLIQEILTEISALVGGVPKSG